MISFIIIGRNEGWKLTKCFQSVFDTIKFTKLNDYEVIYIDSNSTDNSIEIAKSFKEIKIFKIMGFCNAAIARNIGAKESNGDVLFFIDGDMEIIPEFLPLVYIGENELKYNFVSGNLENNYYDAKGKYLYRNNQFNILNDTLQATTGGLFLIKRNIWISVNGMRTKYIVNEDLDLGLRLSKIGIKLLRKKELLARHHTVSYNDSKRMWKLFFKGSELYRVVLLRDHYRNPEMLKDYLRTNYTNLLLILLLLISIYTNIYNLIIGYFIVIILRSIMNMKKDIINIPIRIIYFIIRDISIIFAFFLFWPKEIKIKEYIQIT